MNLIALRKERGITQKKLGEYLGVSRSTVAMWESGKNEPDGEMLVKIAEYFDVSTDYLLGRSEDVTLPVAISVVPTGVPAIDPHKQDLWNAYEALSEVEQKMLCRSLGITHPADERSKASKA